MTQEFSFITLVVIAVGFYLFVTSQPHKAKFNKDAQRNENQKNVARSPHIWDDRHPLFWRQNITSLSKNVNIYFISAFSSELLSRRATAIKSSPISPQICVSRSAEDTNKLVHPLIKKIEASLRRTEIRPRPRLHIERLALPYPLFSSTRPDTELTNDVLNFLDACIDLSISCDTQVNFSLMIRDEGIFIAAAWRKNQLIADASVRIELLEQMRLTMSGETVRWDYQIFYSNPSGASSEESPMDLQATA